MNSSEARPFCAYVALFERSATENYWLLFMDKEILFQVDFKSEFFMITLI